jgi:hypothetical protein
MMSGRWGIKSRKVGIGEGGKEKKVDESIRCVDFKTVSRFVTF